ERRAVLEVRQTVLRERVRARTAAGQGRVAPGGHLGGGGARYHPHADLVDERVHRRGGPAVAPLGLRLPGGAREAQVPRRDQGRRLAVEFQGGAGEQVRVRRSLVAPTSR